MAECQQSSDVKQTSQKEGVKKQITNLVHQSSMPHESMTKNDNESATYFVMPQSETDGEELTGVSLKNQDRKIKKSVDEELQSQKVNDNKVSSKSLNTQSSTVKCSYEPVNKHKYDSVVQTAIDFAIAQSKTAIDFAKSQELTSIVTQNYSQNDNKEATNPLHFESSKYISCNESNVKKGDKSNINNGCGSTIPERKVQSLEVGGVDMQDYNEGILTITCMQVNPLTVKSCYIPMWENDCDSILQSAVEYFVSLSNAKRQEHSGVKQQNLNKGNSNKTIQLLSSSEISCHESTDKNCCDSTLHSGIDYAFPYNNKKFHELAGVEFQNHNEEVHKQVNNTVASKSSTVKSCHQFMKQNACNSISKSVKEFTMSQNSDVCKKLADMELKFNNDNSTSDSAIEFVMPQSVRTNEEVNKIGAKAIEVQSSSIISCHESNSHNWDYSTVHSEELRAVFKELGVVFSTVSLRKESKYCVHESTSSCHAMLQIRSSLISRGLVYTSILLRKRVSNIPPQAKAKRIKFYRNGDEYSDGIIIPVSKKKYSSLEKLLEDLTSLFFHYNSVVSSMAAIYTMCGKPIKYLNELESLNSYVCSGKHEYFKPVCYKGSLQLRMTSGMPAKANNNHSKRKSPIKMSLSPCFLPRTVTLIKGGFKPRMILQFVPNTRNCTTFEKILESISNLFNFASKPVPKIYALSGVQVSQLADFMSGHSVFFVFLKKPVSEDFLLHAAEIKRLHKMPQTPTC